MDTIYITHPYEKRYYVYRIYAEDGLLLYIGSSGDVQGRLDSHSRDSVWFHLAHKVTIKEFASQREARAAEKEAIIAEQPPGNLKWTSRDRNRASSFERWRRVGSAWSSRYTMGALSSVAAAVNSPLRLWTRFD